MQCENNWCSYTFFIILKNDEQYCHFFPCKNCIFAIIVPTKYRNVSDCKLCFVAKMSFQTIPWGPQDGFINSYLKIFIYFSVFLTPLPVFKKLLPLPLVAFKLYSFHKLLASRSCRAVTLMDERDQNFYLLT